MGTPMVPTTIDPLPCIVNDNILYKDVLLAESVKGFLADGKQLRLFSAYYTTFEFGSIFAPILTFSLTNPSKCVNYWWYILTFSQCTDTEFSLLFGRLQGI
jgi:hypothetical protein